MRVRKLPIKQLLLIDFLAFFLVGIVLANLLRGNTFQQNGSVTRYYLKQFQYTDIESRELLWHVGCNRLVLFASLLALTVVAKGKIVHVLFVAWSGFAYGYFCVISISAFGAKGLLLCLVALFPQFLAYVPAYLGLVQLSERRREHVGWRKTAAVVFLFVILIVGILLESYINPLILQKLLKIF